MSLNDILQAPPTPEKKRKSSRKFIFGLLFLALALVVGSTYAANISIGSGNIEFGQGTTLATACDSNMLVTAKSKVDNANFFLDTITISKIDRAACDGKKMKVIIVVNPNNTEMLGVAEFTLDGSSSSALDAASGTLTFTAGGAAVTPASNAISVTAGPCTADGCSLVLSYNNIPASVLQKVLLETTEN